MQAAQILNQLRTEKKALLDNAATRIQCVARVRSSNKAVAAARAVLLEKLAEKQLKAVALIQRAVRRSTERRSNSSETKPHPVIEIPTKGHKCTPRFSSTSPPFHPENRKQQQEVEKNAIIIAKPNIVIIISILSYALNMNHDTKWRILTNALWGCTHDVDVKAINSKAVDLALDLNTTDRIKSLITETISGSRVSIATSPEVSAKYVGLTITFSSQNIQPIDFSIQSKEPSPIMSNGTSADVIQKEDTDGVSFSLQNWRHFNPIDWQTHDFKDRLVDSRSLKHLLKKLIFSASNDSPSPPSLRDFFTQLCLQARAFEANPTIGFGQSSIPIRIQRWRIMITFMTIIQKRSEIPHLSREVYRFYLEIYINLDWVFNKLTEIATTLIPGICLVDFSSYYTNFKEQTYSQLHVDRIFLLSNQHISSGTIFTKMPNQALTTGTPTMEC